MADQSPVARKRKAVVGEGDLENQGSDDKKEKKVKHSSAKTIVLQVVGVVLGLFVLYIIFAPSPIDPVSLESEHDLPAFEGVMEPNEKLKFITKIGHNKLAGPESFAMDKKGNLYTGLADGRIVKVTRGGEVIDIGRTGKFSGDCGKPEFEHECGRPLGLAFDKTESNLLICDSTFGLLKMDMATSEITTLVSAEDGMEGHPFKMVNHLAISSDDVVYFTDSSFKWARKDYVYLALEGGGQGRLMTYDLKTGDKRVLLSGLFFANGVALSPEEDFVLITETTVSRIMRYFLKGDRKGTYDLFADNLPGTPDNIRPAHDGGYWVALPSIRKWPISLLDLVGPYPGVKNVLAKLLPKHVFESFVPKYGLLLKLDYYGDILESYHDPDGSVISHISEVFEDAAEGILYLGSFKNKFIGKLRLKDV